MQYNDRRKLHSGFSHPGLKVILKELKLSKHIRISFLSQNSIVKPLMIRNNIDFSHQSRIVLLSNINVLMRERFCKITTDN